MKTVGNAQVEKELPEGMESDSTDAWEPLAVLASRAITKGGDTVKQVLIHWKGKAAEEATWEEEFTIRNQFPHVRLEDRSAIQGGGIDGDSTADVVVNSGDKQPREWKVYVRRDKKQALTAEVARKEKKN